MVDDTTTPYAGPGSSPQEGATEGRPLGVTVLAILAGAAAALALLASVGAFTAPGDAFGGFAAAMGVFLLLYAVLAAAVAYGLWNGRTWAWYAALVVAGIGILNGALNILAGEFLGGALGLVVNGLILWYLLRDEVKTWFHVGGVGMRARQGRPT